MKNNLLKSLLLCSLCLFTACGGSTDSAGQTPADTTSTESANTAVTAETTPAETEESTFSRPSRAVQSVEDDTDYTGKTTLTYIGHASVKIRSKNGSILYIDPNFYTGNYDDEADYILVTHGHDDHLPCDKVTLKDSGEMITYEEALHDGVYESYELGDFTVQAVPAGGNPNHSIDCCVGYLVTVDGYTIYHAGDTSMIDQMNDLTDVHIDYAMYPIDGVYNMDAVEATEVANLVGAVNNIPIHENDTGSSKKSDKFTPNGRLVLNYGETVVIE